MQMNTKRQKSEICLYCSKPVGNRWCFCSAKCGMAQRKMDLAINHHSFFEDKQYKYEDKIIDYADSPSGRAYIGIAKKPLMPVKEGFGYYGVLLQDDFRKVVQCHSCGKWRRYLNHVHVKACCGITVAEYKKKYGLNMRPGLTSDDLARENTIRALKTGFWKEQGGQRTVGTHKKCLGNRRGEKHSMAYRNKWGTCPDQLKERLYDFIRCNQELPTSWNRGASLQRCLSRTYGNWNKALKFLELPFSDSKRGYDKHYVFPDGSVHRFNLRKMQERDLFYYKMMSKCPVLSKT